MRAIDLENQRFGMLWVACEDGRDARGHKLWRCICDCGAQISRTTSALRAGDVTSCGAHKLPRGRGRTHGLSGSPTYSTWVQMVQRCTNPNAPTFAYYGGRGITLCERWRTFEHFLDDMGVRPDGLTLDRIDNDKGYEPGNCRWATWSEQMSHRRPYAEWPSVKSAGRA